MICKSGRAAELTDALIRTGWAVPHWLGVLAEASVRGNGIIPIPEHLSFGTKRRHVSCAAITAGSDGDERRLKGRLRRPGAGQGGVSLSHLQFANYPEPGWWRLPAAIANMRWTSGKMGARTWLSNYKTTPEWGDARAARSWAARE